MTERAHPGDARSIAYPNPARAVQRESDARRILHTAIAAADPGPAVDRALRDATDLHDARGVYLLAIGKAAGVMAEAALRALHTIDDGIPAARIRSSLVILPQHDTGDEAATLVDAPADSPGAIQFLRAAHPLPDASSVRAAEAVEALLRDAHNGDLVLVLISGGTSSLCAAPVAGVSIEEYAEVVRMLMRAGAGIHELNTVRTHIDRLKGGGMARLIAPADALGLVMSDVVGNRLDIIGSGPLTPATTSADDALRVLTDFHLLDTIPAGVRTALEHAQPLTPDDAAAPPAMPPGSGQETSGGRVRTQIILDNRTAIDGAADEARRLGYDIRVRREPLAGRARDAGTFLARAALAVAGTMKPGDRPVCMISGGETTVEVTGSGRGGRNLELALAAAIALDGDSRVTLASVGTDGIDGSSNAAGGIAGGRTVASGKRAAIDAGDALENNDSHTFLATTGGLIITGPTGTNVMDVQVALIDPPSAD